MAAEHSDAALASKRSEYQMEQIIGLIGIAVVLFASTNIDDVFVLLAFFADPKFRTSQVAVGQFVGIGALYSVSVVASLVSLVLEPAYIGFLGLAPIAIGVKKVWELWKGENSDEEDVEVLGTASARHGNIVTIATVTMANGGDNLSIYTPLFATRSPYDITIIGVVFAIMTAVWLGFAYWLTNHRTIGAPIRRYGHRVVPFVLVALGCFILYEAGTFALLHP